MRKPEWAMPVKVGVFLEVIHVAKSSPALRANTQVAIRKGQVGQGGSP
jgi:hypothetical protein